MEGIEGLANLLGRLENLTDEMLSAGEKGMQRGVKLLVDQAKANAPVTTGQLRNSIRGTVEVDGGAVKGTVEATADYAVYVEMGTGPRGEFIESGYGQPSPEYYSVTHRTTGWAYKDPKTGERIWTLGSFARPFLYPAYLATREPIADLIQASITSEIQKKSTDGGGAIGPPE